MRLFREWRGLSQEEVGCILEMSASAVQAIEYGEGAPEWVRYALFGWSVMYDGQSPRTVARYLGLPWEHYPVPADPEGPSPDERRVAHLDALRAPLEEPESRPPATAHDGGDVGEPDALTEVASGTNAEAGDAANAPRAAAPFTLPAVTARRSLATERGA